MRLIRLDFRAIGPFAGEHIIDFADVSASGLFLLDGPTGSGKSTIIDAITYALYGSTATSVGSTERMRSELAGPTVSSYVDLIFEVNAGIYRVRRSPAYQRPKARGEGTTTEPAAGWLWRITDPDDLDGGEVISTRHQDIGQRVTELVGLSREQFTQTVILPQGEFTTFLRSRSEDRAAVLQRVFGTEIYERAAQELAERRRMAYEQVRAARDKLSSAVDAFCGATGVDLDDEVRSAQPEVLAEALANAAESLADQSAEAEAKRTTAGEVAAHAQERLQAARGLAAQIQRLAELDQKANALAEQTPQIEAAAAEVAAAQAASVVVTAASRQTAAAATLAEAAKQVDAARALVASAASPTDATGAAADLDEEFTTETAERQDRELTAAVERLSHIVEIETALPRRREDLAREQEAVAQRRATLTQSQQDLSVRDSSRAGLIEQLTSARTIGAGHGAAVAALSAAQAVLALWEQAAREETTVREREEQVAAARQEAVRAGEAAQQALARWVAGLAGELAAELTADEPCPVCGSTEHPAPAQSAEQITREQVDEAENASSTAKANWRAQESLLTEARSRVDELRAQLPDGTRAETQDQVRQAEAAVQAAATAQQEATQLEQELADFDTGTADLKEAISTEAQAIEGVAARLESDQTALAKDNATVAAQLAGFQTVAQRQASLIGQRDAWRQAATALRSQAEAAARVEERASELAAALADSDFADQAAAEAAARAPEVIQHLQNQVSEHRDEVQRVTGALAELATVREVPAPDVAAAQEAYEAAEQALTEATGTAATAARRDQDARTRFAEVQRAQAQVAAQGAAVAATIRVADVANAATSDVAHRVDLKTYVLMRRFEDVLIYANEHLDTMTGGRLRLERTDEREGRALRTGLGLAVLDTITDGSRPPTDISGGESFMVSLALALGLASVVQGEAGGIEMDTLFIDEGFGSLDDETLDAVMAVLGRLRESGRTIGVVSHVESMKQTIADGIRVMRDANGVSQVYSRTGDAPALSVQA